MTMTMVMDRFHRGSRSARGVALTGLLLLSSLAVSVHAFTPAALRRNRNVRRGGGFLVDPSPQAAASHSGSSVALNMNLVENFISEKDMERRSADNQKYLDSLSAQVEQINALEPDIEDLGDDELAAKTTEFRERLAKGEELNGGILTEAFAVVREAAWRVLEQRHYDVQLLGGLILHDGRLAEMATGEGKTLVATLPCYANALTGKSAFVITTNDYLARRDMEKMGQIHRFLGLSVGLIQSSMTEPERRKAYACDVVYVTNSELGFDYLRDNLALSQEQTVLPTAEKSGQFEGFCVVDEADSVLIDEARTPLIISKQVPAPAQKYQIANKLAGALKSGLHYDVDEKNKNIVLNQKAYQDCEDALSIQSLFEGPADGSGAWAPYVVNAVKAKELFTKDKDYTILEEDGNQVGIGIIDSFTGRVLDGRRWSDGLHQSIEAKEGIPVSERSQVIAKVTYQSLFRQFSRLSGMTGTAMTDAGELEKIYDLRVSPVPPALPVARRDYPDVCFRTRKAADDALVKEVIAVGGGESDGRPCLIGTTSVSQSEQVVAALAEAGIRAELLNASPDNAAREGEIIAQAGRAGVVTVATNMAGRGTDILLGGCPSTMSRIKVRSVLIDQGVLSKDAAKSLPPPPREDYFPAPLEDDVTLLLKEAASAMKASKGTDLTALELDEILTVATDTTEGEDDEDFIIKLRDATEAVKDIYKPVLEKEKEGVLNSGGLYVMGTARHESRRIDGQLRGRAGRQGDPGTSRFFLSFQDDMFVIFGGDGMGKILETFRVSDDMPVEAPQVSKALDSVQRTVEEKYEEIREQILNFDEVLNGQRSVIYKRRQKILFSSPEETLKLMDEYNKDTVADIVKAQTAESGEVDLGKVLEKIEQFFPPVAPVIDSDDLAGLDQDGVTAFIGVAVEEVMKAKVNEAEKKASSPNSLARSANYITLVSMDNAWSDHLQNMEDLKEGVVFLKYMGRDIVAEYQSEAFKMFKGLEDKMRFNAIYSLWQSL